MLDQVANVRREKTCLRPVLGLGADVGKVRTGPELHLRQVRPPFPGTTGPAVSQGGTLDWGSSRPETATYRTSITRTTSTSRCPKTHQRTYEQDHVASDPGD